MNKTYDPLFHSDVQEKVLFICGIVFFLCALLDHVFNGGSLADLFFAFCLAAWYLLAMLLFFKLWNGYCIRDDGIVFHCRLVKNKLLYQDIQCILVTNGWRRHGIVKTPYVALIGGKPDEILRYCAENPRHRVLSSADIQSKLGAAIGHYEEIQQMFRKGSSHICNYGFLWNKREMHRILERFSGNYYIAASVLQNFYDEFRDIAKKYSISSERIHVINDSTNGKFIWW